MQSSVQNKNIQEHNAKDFSKHGFFRLFPTPKFLEMPWVGLSISDEAVRFVELVKTARGLRLGRYGGKNIPEGVIISGYVHKPEELVSVLKNLRKENHLKFVRATLPEDKSYLFKVEVPFVVGANIRDSIEFKIEENVPVRVSESVFDYSILNSDKEKGKVDAVVSVLPEKTVSTYLDVIRSSGMETLSFLSESHAIARAVVKKGFSGTALLVNISKTRAAFSIVSGGIVQFSSSVSIDNEVSAVRPEQQNSHFSLALRKTKSAVAEEVKKLRAYWEGYTEKNNQNSKIERIYAVGKEAETEGWAEQIASEAETSLEIANVWVNIFASNDYVPDISFGDSLDYAAAIGMALPV